MKRSPKPHRKPACDRPPAAMTRRTFLGAAAAAAVAVRCAGGRGNALSARLCGQQAGAHRSPRGSHRRIVPDRGRLDRGHAAVGVPVLQARRLAGRPTARTARSTATTLATFIRPQMPAYLWGHDATFAREMGRRIFQDQSDPTDGRLRWDSRGQCSIHLAQTAKHFSDYMVYAGQDDLVRDNWEQMLKTLKWGLAHYDPEQTGLIEQGPFVTDHFWALLVGEPYNFAAVENCSRDVAVVSSMEVYEWLKLAGEFAAGRNLPKPLAQVERRRQAHEAIETSAWDPDAGYYYLLYRRPERRWQHSILRINEESRELDVTPYYAALLSGNPRGRRRWPPMPGRCS